MNKRVLNISVKIIILMVIIITILFSIPFIQFIQNPEQLRKYLESFGVFAPIIYVFLVLFQILIPFIPGEPFELLAGYAFGFIKGSLLCFFAETLASFLIIYIVKKWGLGIIEYFFSKDKIEKLKFLQNKKAFLLYTLLFVIPGTPKDILCYIGALCDFKLIPLLFVTSFCRLPSILTSTIPGDAFGNQNYTFGILVYLFTICISIIGLIVYNTLEKKHNKKTSN